MKKIKSGKWGDVDVVPTLSTFLQTHLTRVDLIDLPESGAPRLVLELRPDLFLYISRGGPIYMLSGKSSPLALGLLPKSTLKSWIQSQSPYENPKFSLKTQLPVGPPHHFR